MGGARAYEEDERPYELDSQGRGICDAHLLDDHLQSSVNAVADARRCAICNRRATTDVDAINEVVWEVIRLHYTEDADSYRDEDGEMLIPWFDSPEAIESVAGAAVDEELLEILRALCKDRQWIERGAPGPSEAEWLLMSWQRFSDFVIHESRFFFREDDDPVFEDVLDPAKMLAAIDRIIDHLGLLHSLPAGTSIYRARVHDGGRNFSPAELGAPPPGVASQGRMNPAGISLFYGAEEATTAAVEAQSTESHATVALFRTVVDLQLVDLCDVALVSPFDEAQREYVEQSWFLREFGERIARPIARDNRIHQEYVPTQALTEYLRYRSEAGDGSIDGIRFPSARQPGGHDVVLFYGPEGNTSDEGLAALDPPVYRRRQRQVLRYQSDTLYRFGPPTVAPVA